MASETMAQPSRRTFRELWMISVGHGLTHWYPATFFLLLPIIARELGLSYSQVGMIMFVDGLTTAAANVPAGMLVDVLGRRRLLMALALFGVGMPYLLLSMSGSLWAVLLCVTFTGIGNNLWHPTAIPALTEIYPDRKGFALSLHGMGANLGDALAPLAIGALLGLMNWRQVIVVNLAPGVLMGVAILILLPGLKDAIAGPAAKDAGSRQDALQEYFSNLRVLIRNRNLLMISAISGLRSMTQKTLTTFLPLYLANQLGYSTLWVGLGISVLQGGGFVAAPIAGYMSDRVGRRKALLVIMTASAVALVVMTLAGGTELFIGLVAVVGFFLFAIRPVMQAWVMEVTPKKTAGTSVGLLFGIQSLGSSIGPLVGGLVADRFGLTVTFYYVAATILVANLFVLAMPERT